MFISAFALISAIGSWYAWRRNPLYSTRATLKAVASITLAVAALMTAAIGTAELTKDASQAIALGSIGLVILVGGLALIWLAIRVSIPPIAPLPRSMKLINVNRAKLVPWVWRLGWTTLGIIALALVLPKLDRPAAYVIGALVLVLAIAMFFGGFIVALDADRSLTSIEASPWVHWRYTPEQWEAWTAVEASRTDSASPAWNWRHDTPGLAISLLIMSAIMFGLNFNTIPWRWEALFIGATWALTIAIVALAHLRGPTAARRVREVVQVASPEAYFGTAGMFVDGSYTAWKAVANYLIEATVDEREPRSLSFVFERMSSGASTAVTVRQGVLVPVGADDDIARLQAELSRVCPTAHIALRSPAAAATS